MCYYLIVMKPVLLVLFCLLTLFALPAIAIAHIIPTVTHTYTIHLGEKSSAVSITYFYDPVVISRYIKDFDLNSDRTIDDGERSAWQEKYLKNIQFMFEGKPIQLEHREVTIPSLNGLMNDGEPVEITGELKMPISCTKRSILEVTDTNAFMSVDDDIYTFDVFKKGCLNSAVETPARNKAMVQVGKVLQETKQPVTAQKSTAGSQIAEITQVITNKNMSGSLFFWALGIAFILGGLHALTPGHGKTLVAAYLVGQHGTKKDAFILALVTTLTHTSSIYILGLISLFAAHYFLPEKIIPVLETLSALSIFALGVWLLSKRWAEFKHAHEHHHEHHDHEHGTGPGQHVHTLSDLNGERLGLKSLISLGFSGGIVPCPDALAIMIIAIGLNKTVLGMILIFFFSMGLAAVLVALGVLLVTSRNLFERYAPSAKLARYFPIASALIIIAIGGLLVLKATRIV